MSISNSEKNRRVSYRKAEQRDGRLYFEWRAFYYHD